MMSERRLRVTSKRSGKSYYVTEGELARRARPRRVRSWPAIPRELHRDDAIKLIRDALKKRSRKAWSVRSGGRGTTWGWIRIDVPPSRLRDGEMTDEDREELSDLLDLDQLVSRQGESVPASSAHYREYIERARGIKPSKIAEAYWD